jgi:hypothetical protein
MGTWYTRHESWAAIVEPAGPQLRCRGGVCVSGVVAVCRSLAESEGRSVLREEHLLDRLLSTHPRLTDKGQPRPAHHEGPPGGGVLRIRSDFLLLRDLGSNQGNFTRYAQNHAQVRTGSKPVARKRLHLRYLT